MCFCKFIESLSYFFFTFFHIFNSFFAWFWVCSENLVSTTPSTVLHRSFWIFTCISVMVWRYAYAFYRILEYFFFFFFFFFFILTWRLFFHASILWKCTCSRYLVSATPPTVLYHSHWNFTDVLTYSFIPFPLKLYRCFNLSLKISICFLQNLEITFYTFFTF